MEHIKNGDCFGSVVKSARQAKGMTQSQLSERLSITTRYLKAIENSGRKPSCDLLVRIIQELDIPIAPVFHPAREDETKKVVLLKKVQ